MGRLFAEDGDSDMMPPGPLLGALTEQAVRDVTGLSDDELIGVLRASQRLVAREHYKAGRHRPRTHHRAKQAPDWTVQQPAPGVTRWTLPSGRTHVTTPTKYDT